MKHICEWSEFSYEGLGVLTDGIALFQGIPGELGAVGQIGPRVGDIHDPKNFKLVEISDWLWPFYFPRESVEFLGREESWVPLVCRDLRVSLAHQVQMGQRYWTEASPACTSALIILDFDILVLCLSISILCYFILTLNYFWETNTVLFPYL